MYKYWRILNNILNVKCVIYEIIGNDFLKRIYWNDNLSNKK